MSVFYQGTLKARIRRNVSLVTHSLYVDLNRDVTKSIFICGAGRSGTTWLGEVLNFDNRYRVVYEPFNREQVPVCRRFSPRQYLRPSGVYPEHAAATSTVFSGAIRSAWVDQYNRRVLVRERLIKDVRSTLMLKWIRDRFPRTPIVFIVRNPCAVAVSRAHLGWRTNLREVFLSQPELVEDHLRPVQAVIAEAASPFERHIIDWCIENAVPFSQLQANDVCLVFYEKLMRDPVGELLRICEYVGRTFDESALKKITSPSASTVQPKSSEASRMGQAMSSWRTRITGDEVEFARRALTSFGLQNLYGANDEPDEIAARTLLSQGGVGPPSTTSKVASEASK